MELFQQSKRPQAESQYPDLDEPRRFPWLGQDHPGRAIASVELVRSDIDSIQVNNGLTEDPNEGTTDDDTNTTSARPLKNRHGKKHVRHGHDSSTGPNFSLQSNKESETEFLLDEDLRGHS